MKNYSDWARRRAGKGSNGGPARQSGPQAEGPGQLPPPPAGYGWVHNPQYGWMAVPLAGGAPAPQYAPTPIPQNPPARQNVVHRSPAPVSTCTLVKPGSRDTYAELMAGVPDLVPPSGWDAMAGNPDPAVLQELQAMPEFHDVGPGANHDSPTQAYPSGRQLATKIGDLRGSNG